MANFKTSMTVEEILKEMNNNQGNTETIYAGHCFLQYKLQENLSKEQEDRQRQLLNLQNEYNNKQLFWTRFLVIGTWALVIATSLLLIIK